MAPESHGETQVNSKQGFSLQNTSHNVAIAWLWAKDKIMNLGEKKGVLDNCCDMLRHGIRNLDHFQGGLEGFWLALLHHCIKTFPCIILLWHWGLFPLQTWRKKGEAPAAFCKVVFIFFRNFWKFLGIAAFARFTRWFNQDTYIIFWGDVLEIGILTWPAIICDDWLLGVECDPHLLEAKTSRYWTWMWHRSCRLERLGGWSWLKTDFPSWNMDLFEAEKRSYWRVPPTHFPLFPMIVGGFVYWLPNLGTPKICQASAWRFWVIMPLGLDSFLSIFREEVGRQLEEEAVITYLD